MKLEVDAPLGELSARTRGAISPWQWQEREPFSRGPDGAAENLRLRWCRS